MKYAKLGSSELNVSQLCIGGMSFGNANEGRHSWILNQDDTTNMISYSFELGVNFIDTANVYANGTSEEFIGNAIKKLNIPRDKIILATKVFWNPDKLKKSAILREIDGSLKRLQTDYVDLYYIHRFDYDTPIEETLETLDSLIKAGKVRALGASSMYGYQFHNMQECAEKNGWTKFVAMQNHYNLLYREDEHELIPVCQQYNVSLVPFSPLAAGHLCHTGWNSGSKRDQEDQVMAQKYDRSKEYDLKIVERVSELATRYECSMTEIALAWLYKKGVVAPIVGATKISHFDQAVHAIEIKLTDEDSKFLEEFYVPHELVGQIRHDGSMY